MLKTLLITDLAIVERLTIEFAGGLNVITGETGAGKSIVVGAIGLLLGARAQVEMVRTGKETAVCEGEFSVAKMPAALELLCSLGVMDDGPPPSGVVRVRREIYRKGGSRCFINDRLVNVAELRAVGARLGDLCGQHQHQSLLDPKAHVNFLDERAGLREQVDDFKIGYGRLKTEQDRWCQMTDRAEIQRQARELARFQIVEIRAAGLTPTEEDDLRQELKVLKNAQRLTETGDNAIAALAEEDGSAGDQIALARKELLSLVEIDPRLAPITTALETCETQLLEIIAELRAYGRGVDCDPHRAEEIEARLAVLFELKRKYGPTCRDILAQLAELEHTLESQRTLDDQIVESARQVAAQKKMLGTKAQQLSRARKAAAASLSGELEATFREIGMSGARWHSRVEPVTASPVAVDIDGRETPVSENGMDEIEFEIETNPGEGFKPLVKIASGGELSRVMLALKAVGGSRRDVSFLVFDEVDSGIGGEVAYAVGQRLKILSQHYQVFLISHLPQMASLADQHYQVLKTKTGRRVTTKIALLNKQERVAEVARMMAAGEITAATRRHAAEVIASSAAPPTKK
jgi:DNA repair protein RecN (Recombination protein N)